MKNILMCTALLAITISAIGMEKGKKPFVLFKFNNESDSTMQLSYDLTIGKSIAKVNAHQGYTVSTNIAEWKLSKDNMPILSIQMKAQKNPSKNLTTLTALMNKTGELAVAQINKQAKIFDINSEQSYIVPITITSDLEIEINEPVYPIPEYRENVPTQKINIKGKTFQVPEELIKLRAPNLKYLTE